jgi:predicted  nucleic acid-binding Zn-ribbon protein
MSSSIIGRTACPECDFKSAHVKQGPKSIYRYCPECGSQYFPRNERQLDLLKTKMRPLVDAPTSTATVAEVGAISVTHHDKSPATGATATDTTGELAPASATDATPTPTKRRGLFA